jgi:hypothetical protein
MLKFLHLSDGHQFVLGIHQSKEPMAPIQAVIPNTPEAKCMIVMMNKNFPAYVGNVLKDQGLPEDFLLELFQQTCCHTMVAEISFCTWDSETGTLTTIKELAQEKMVMELENTPWFKDTFSDLDLGPQMGKNQPAPPPETLFDLDREWSVKTIHECHIWKTTLGSPPPEENRTEQLKIR